MQTGPRNVEPFNDTRPAQGRPNVKKGMEDGWLNVAASATEMLKTRNLFHYQFSTFQSFFTNPQ